MQVRFVPDERSECTEELPKGAQGAGRGAGAPLAVNGGSGRSRSRSRSRGGGGGGSSSNRLGGFCGMLQCSYTEATAGNY